jgi:aspartyl-tRNA(Asn)/glutamyl-tRNA(Gln) amidotransferase subunit C
MISKEEVKRLADLARIEIGEGEAEELAGEMDAILGYVGQVKSVVSDDYESSVISYPDQGEGRHEVRGEGVNVLREDEVLHQPGEFSRELINEFPDKEGDYLKVKKILG